MHGNAVREQLCSDLIGLQHTVTEQGNQVYSLDYRPDGLKFATAGQDYQVSTMAVKDIYIFISLLCFVWTIGLRCTPALRILVVWIAMF